MSTKRLFSHMAAVAALAATALTAAAPAHAADSALAPCNVTAVSDWTAGADQYTEYYEQILQFSALVPVPQATAWDMPSKPSKPSKKASKKTKANYQLALSAYKRNVSALNKTAAADTAANERRAARLREDLETVFKRATEDVNASSTNRETQVETVYSRQDTALDQCRELLDVRFNFEFSTKSRLLQDGMQDQVNGAQIHYENQIVGAQNHFNGQMDALDTGAENALANCAEQFDVKPIKNVPKAIKKPKASASKAAKKKYADNRSLRKTVIADNTKARKTNTAEERAHERCVGAANAAHTTATTTLNATLDAQLTDAQRTLDATQLAAERAYTDASTTLENQFTLNGLTRSHDYDNAKTELENKRDLVLMRSRRQLTNEQRAIDDAYTLAQRTIEDLYGSE